MAAKALTAEELLEKDGEKEPKRLSARLSPTFKKLQLWLTGRLTK